jgi:gentisate 1,2-dioxygenase
MAVESAQDQMQAFYDEINTKWLHALWSAHQRGDRPTDPVAPYAPAHWRWSEIRAYMARAGELVQPGPDAQRRVLTLNNPSIKPTSGATHTLTGAVQMVLPGEVAPSHRHTNAAIRFIIEGEGATTIVDGEPIPMVPGDLVLTPGWCYHGHVSKAEGPVLWMDSLDAPLVVEKLKIARYEQYADDLEPAHRPLGDSTSRYGGNLRPVWQNERTRISPQMVYPWDRTLKALHDLAKIDASPFDDVAFEYTNPTTGGPVLPTIGCWIQMLRPGIATKAHRHCSSSVYHVVRGRGHSIVDGVQIDWEEGDFFSLPPWCWHEHANDSTTDEAILFSTTDIPVMDALNLFEEQEHPKGHQEVTAGFDARYRG